MLVFPEINPVAFSLGFIQVHWYGIMYLFGFIAAWGLARFRARHYHLPWTASEISDLIFYAALGVIIGGRIGYMLFYNTQAFLANPLLIFKLWEDGRFIGLAGMSFHGGLIGVAVALYLFARRTKKSFLQIGDFVAPLVPLGLAAGRLGNFINGELWGRVSDVPWAMIFPNTDGMPRHPSQLYEFALEGVLLFIVVFCYSSKPRPEGRVAAVFLIGYALCRFIVEFFREPDSPLGFIAFNWLTMGQLLSLPMLVVGLILWWKRCKTT